MGVTTDLLAAGILLLLMLSVFIYIGIEPTKVSNNKHTLTYTTRAGEQLQKLE